MSERKTTLRETGYSQTDVTKEILGSLEDLFAEYGREVLLNCVVAFHGSRIESRVRKFPVCTPFFTTRKKRHALWYASQFSPKIRVEV